MSTENESRLNVNCLVGNLAATVVTKCGIVYQGTILDWNCARIGSENTCNSSSNGAEKQEEHSTRPCMDMEGKPNFIRMELACIPGNICCPIVAAATASRVTPILGFDASTTPLYADNTTVLINWEDVSSIGSIGLPTVCLTEV